MPRSAYGSHQVLQSVARVSGTRMLKHEGCLHLSPITSELVREYFFFSPTTSASTHVMSERNVPVIIDLRACRLCGCNTAGLEPTAGLAKAWPSRLAPWFAVLRWCCGGVRLFCDDWSPLISTAFSAQSVRPDKAGSLLPVCGNRRG